MSDEFGIDGMHLCVEGKPRDVLMYEGRDDVCSVVSEVVFVNVYEMFQKQYVK